MNAIIGDNGIITRAQEANIQSSIASLEEYLQLKYTENYEEMSKYQSKIEGLTNVCSSYFYIPIKEGIGGLWYVVDSDGHALYLIKKSGLPEEIRESLVGGDAGKGEYADYSTLNDVYGVTSNLKVYYCSGGVDSIKGLAKENLDNDNPLREVFGESSKMTGLLTNYDVNNDGIINAEEVKSVKTFEIDEKSGITNLSDLYNLNGLQELTLRNIKLDSFAGIENCSQINYICLENFTSDDYSKINSLENKLQYLYLINTNDDEVAKLCSRDRGIANGAFSKLQYFALSGDSNFINTGSDAFKWNQSTHSDLSDISVLADLNIVTKEAVKYLSLNNNKITSVTSLKDYKNVFLLRVETNNLTSLSGIENMVNLAYLYAGNNNLGESEVEGQKNMQNDSLAGLEKKTNLYLVYLENNSNLKWVDYLKHSVNIRGLFLKGCVSLRGESLSEIKDIFNSCIPVERSIDQSLEKYLSGDDVFVYANLTEDDTNDIDYLINLSQENKNKVKKLDLSGSTLSNEKLNEILEGFNGVVCLNVNNCQKLSTFDFLAGKNSLEQIFFENTAIIGDEVSKLNNTNCQSLKCNNPDINLTAMEKTLNNCKLYYGKYAFSGYCGAGLTNAKLIKKLENCTGLTQLVTNCMASSEEVLVDLSNTKLTYLYDQPATGNIKWKLPQCFTGIRSSDGSKSTFYDPVVDIYHFSENTSINSLVINGNADDGFRDMYEDILTSLESSNSTVTYLRVGAPKSFSTLKEFLEKGLFGTCGIKELVISQPSQKIDLSNLNESWYENFTNLSGLILSNLKLNNLNFLRNSSYLSYVELTSCDISDISGISNLLSLSTLKIPNNSVSNTYYLKNLTNLVTLDLSSNALQSQYNYDEDGEHKSVNNLEILANLSKSANKGGKLENLYLKGNALLTTNDYAYLTKYSWTDWTGFNNR